MQSIANDFQVTPQQIAEFQNPKIDFSIELEDFSNRIFIRTKNSITDIYGSEENISKISNRLCREKFISKPRIVVGESPKIARFVKYKARRQELVRIIVAASDASKFVIVWTID